MLVKYSRKDSMGAELLGSWILYAIIVIPTAVYLFAPLLKLLFFEDRGLPVKEAVDLGLSVKWASCNVGASKPKRAGGYYKDTKVEQALQLKWGGAWRLPTAKEVNELVEKCEWSWEETDKKHRGYKVTGPNGNSIFLPATGYVILDDMEKLNIRHDFGERGGYWIDSDECVETPYKMVFCQSKRKIVGFTKKNKPQYFYITYRWCIRPVL